MAAEMLEMLEEEKKNDKKHKGRQKSQIKGAGGNRLGRMGDAGVDASSGFCPLASSDSCKYRILTTKPLAPANCTGSQKREIGVFKAEEVFRFGVVCQKVELHDENPDESEDLL